MNYIIKIISDFLRFKEFSRKGGSKIGDYELLESFTQMYHDPPITEQFLISKGYKKMRDTAFALIRAKHQQDVWIEINPWYLGGIIIMYDDNLHDYTLYNGKIPTESQYEVLNQLLELHGKQ